LKDNPNDEDDSDDKYHLNSSYTYQLNNSTNVEFVYYDYPYKLED